MVGGVGARRAASAASAESGQRRSGALQRRSERGRVRDWLRRRTRGRRAEDAQVTHGVGCGMPGVVFAVRGGGGAESGARGDDGGAHGGRISCTTRPRSRSSTPPGRFARRKLPRRAMRRAATRTGETRDGGGAPGRDGRAGVRPSPGRFRPHRLVLRWIACVVIYCELMGQALFYALGAAAAGAAPGRGRGQDVAQEFGVLPTGAAGVCCSPCR